MISKTVELITRRNRGNEKYASGRLHSTFKVTTIRFLGIPVWKVSALFV